MSNKNIKKNYMSVENVSEKVNLNMHLMKFMAVVSNVKIQLDIGLTVF